MCVPQLCSLLLTLLLNLPIAVWVFSLNGATDQLKLVTIPFVVSPVSSLLLYCTPRGRSISCVFVFLLSLSSLGKLVACGFISDMAAQSTDALLAVFLGLSGLSDFSVVLSEWRNSRKTKGASRLNGL
jgi:hypothetical protein